MQYRILSNGYKIPNICFGTDIVDYKVTFTERAKQKTKFALKSVLRKDTRKYKKDTGIINCTFHSMENGCNFFDTSRAYDGAECMLREGLKGKKRESYYICTKLNNRAQLQEIPAKIVLKESMKQRWCKLY